MGDTLAKLKVVLEASTAQYKKEMNQVKQVTKGVSDSIQAAMQPWEHGVKYSDIVNLYDKYVEEGGSQVNLYKDVIIQTLAVSGFFTQKMAEELLEATEEEL